MLLDPHTTAPRDGVGVATRGQYTRRNGGMFPGERVYRIIDGRDVPSHGDREMPVWGDVFRMTPSSSAIAGVKARIDAVVRYLEGIQERGA